MADKKQRMALAGLLCGSLALASEASAAVSAGVLSVAENCAPSVHPSTMALIVQHESRGNPFAIGVNNGKRLVEQPTSKGSAIRIARDLQARGKNFDAGLGQLNSVNIAKMGLSFDQAFDPCENLRASAAILEGCYERAGEQGGSQHRLRRALSCYNTGSFERGFANGYVASVAAGEGYSVPELIVGSGRASGPVSPQESPTEDKPRLRGGKPDAFGAAKGGAFAAPGKDRGDVEQSDGAQDEPASADDQRDIDHFMEELRISAV